MKKCVFCGNDFEELSEEHIIPNCICGRLKSYDVLCETCNSELGDNIDTALDGVYNQIINMFAIPRDRGESQPAITVDENTGKLYQYLHDGSYELAEPTTNFEKNENGTIAIKIEANPKYKKQLKNALGKELAEHKEELQKAGIKDFRTEAKKIISRIDTEWNSIAKEVHEDKPAKVKAGLQIGGIEHAFATLKIAYLFFKHNKPEIKIDDEDIIRILKTKSENVWNRCIMYGLKNNLFQTVEDEISHFIFVKGSKRDKKIVVYIELFSISQFICILNENYLGNDFSFSYGFNLLSQKEFTPICNELESLDNLQAIQYRNIPEETFERTQNNFARILKLYYKLHPSRNWNECQLKVRRKIEELVGSDVANSPLIESCIELMNKAGKFEFTDTITEEQKDEVVTKIAYNILECIVFDILNHS